VGPRIEYYTIFSLTNRRKKKLKRKNMFLAWSFEYQLHGECQRPEQQYQYHTRSVHTKYCLYKIGAKFVGYYIKDNVNFKNTYYIL